MRHTQLAGSPPSKKLEDLTVLQLTILAAFWKRGEATVHEIHETLQPTLGLARGTIGTLLHRLEKQGVLTYRIEGREYYYRPTVTREAVQAAHMTGLLGGLFDGDVAALVSFAVSKGDVDGADLARIHALIDQHAKRSGR